MEEGYDGSYGCLFDYVLMVFLKGWCVSVSRCVVMLFSGSVLCVVLSF